MSCLNFHAEIIASRKGSGTAVPNPALPNPALLNPAGNGWDVPTQGGMHPRGQKKSRELERSRQENTANDPKAGSSSSRNGLLKGSRGR